MASPENHASRSDLTRQAARLDLPVSVEEGQVCFSVWSPLIPTTIKPTGEGPMVGAAWCAMAASAFLITGGWIITGLVAAMVSFGLIFGLAGRFTQIVVDEESLAIMRGSSLFARVGARLGLAAIDDFVARDASLLVLVGVREYAIPMETPDEAERLAGLLRGFLLSIDSRPRPLAKRTQISAGD